MSNLIFSLNATIPVFAVMVLGYFLKQIGLLNDSFIKTANKFNFTVTLPVLLFKDISSMDIRQLFDIKFFLFCFLVTIICFVLIWVGSEIFIKDKSVIGSFVQGSFRGSAAVLGIALIQNIYGNSALASLMIISCVPLYNIFSVIVLSFKSTNKELNKADYIKTAFINILKNPILIGIFLGLPFSFFNVSFPPILDKTLISISSLATPLALIVIGAAFDIKAAFKKMKLAFISGFIKLFGQALIFIPIAIWLGFRNESLIAILIMLCSPATPSCYIMAKSMGNDDVLASSIIVVTTLFSAFSLTLALLILKNIGAI